MTCQNEIYDGLKKRISNGEFAEGSRMPSVRTLISEYKSSQGTIGHVLKRMCYEGLIRAEHGRGCFVNPPSVKTSPMRQVIICERGGGVELYKDFISSFYSEFADRSDVMLSVEDVCSEKFSSELLLEKISYLIQQDALEAIFIDGEQDKAFSFDQLQKIEELTDNIYCYFNPKQIHHDAQITSVFIDWHHVGYISVKHFLEIGCRNILCVTAGAIIEQGVYDALDDSTINAEIKVVSSYEKCVELIKKNKIRFDGIFIRDDCNIGNLLPVLKEYGYKFPHDIAIVGLYDTAWSSPSNFNLTSINIQPEKIAKILVNIHKGNSSKISQAVKPKLICRQSTKFFKPK